MTRARVEHPLAIAMWDFSWLERRWPGAGYEDWNQVLDELKKRGYDAVRIDAYPHLVSADPEREWELLPVWNQHDWGSPALNRISVQPFLNEFIAKCAERGLWVGLSTWFRQDRDNTRLHVQSPRDLGQIWKTTLDSIHAARLLGSILYVDLWNEFPLDVWAPFLKPQADGTQLRRASEDGRRWMSESIAITRQAYPQLDYCFSFTSEYETWREQDVSVFDLLELHLWMTTFCDFYQQVGYGYEQFDPKGYENLVQHGEALYRQRPHHWKAALQSGIDFAAEWSRYAGKPLMTTECWAVVDYKDWPLLRWDWIKELCAFGVRQASATGRWVAMATSNFCGPQFVGMWRDVRWHQMLTDVIHNGPILIDRR